MRSILRLWLLTFLFIPAFHTDLLAQQTDTLQKYQDPPQEIQKKTPLYKSKVFKATVVPALLIGYGVSVIGYNGFYSSQDARADIQDRFPDFHTKIDDPLLIMPYLELAAANLFNQKSNHDFVNTSLLILKAEAIYAVAVFGLKEVTNTTRPNGENDHSMPSGHTAQAFLAASILHSELKHRSNWYGVGAYSIATSVGVFRMLNDKHWQSDVFVGAGLGILCSHAAYLSHRNRWGRKPSFAIAPAYLYGAPAISLSMNFDELYKKKTPAAFGQRR